MLRGRGLAVPAKTKLIRRRGAAWRGLHDPKGMPMVSPDDQLSTKADFCSGAARAQRCVILPWKSAAAHPSNGVRPRADAQAGIGAAETDGFGLIQLPIDKIKREIQSSQPAREARPKWLSPAELHRLYAGTPVPPHRYFAPLLNAAATSPEIATDPAKWLAGIADVNISSVVNDWLNTNRSTEYEQLNCIGLEPDAGCLAAIVTVKKGHGYSGGPATAGSREFVAFWVDWGAGFQYEGTTSVAVHDFGSLPPAGLEYSVYLPVDLLSLAQIYGGEARKVKVLAVLSWNIPSSTIYPHSPVVWGDRMESLLQLPAAAELRAAGQSSGSAAAGPMRTNLNGADGRIIAAAIHSLSEMAFGADAGLTVVPDSALTGPGAAESDAAIHIAGAEQSAGPFTLYAWDRTKVNRGAFSHSKFAPAVPCRPVKSSQD